MSTSDVINADRVCRRILQITASLRFEVVEIAHRNSSIQKYNYSIPGPVLGPSACLPTPLQSFMQPPP